MDLNELTMQSGASSSPQDSNIEIYTPKGVCSKLIRFQVEDGILHNVEFTGGCNGNLQGISKLVEGMHVSDVADRLRGIHCGNRPTSCPDQLVRALSPYLAG